LGFEKPFPFYAFVVFQVSENPLTFFVANRDFQERLRKQGDKR
jgi:hypothetical protein